MPCEIIDKNKHYRSDTSCSGPNLNNNRLTIDELWKIIDYIRNSRNYFNTVRIQYFDGDTLSDDGVLTLKNQGSRHVRYEWDAGSVEQINCIEIRNASISREEITFWAVDVDGGAEITVWRIDFSEDDDTEVAKEFGAFRSFR